MSAENHMARHNDILTFWFQGAADDCVVDKKVHPYSQWFCSNPDFDRKIKERFQKDLIKACEGGYELWKGSSEGILALILLFDQFTRNIYRGTSHIYDNDMRAQELVLYGIEQKKDIQLRLIERVFFYMPLMHAEDIALQELSVQKFTNLVDESVKVNHQNTPYYAYHLNYAKKFCDQIKKFGCFPHRKQ